MRMFATCGDRSGRRRDERSALPATVVGRGIGVRTGATLPYKHRRWTRSCFPDPHFIFVNDQGHRRFMIF